MEMALDWNDLRYFLAVARVHNLTEASRTLMVSPATIARRIAALEQALDARLFTKRPDGYALTASGEAMLPRAEQAEAQLLSLERDGAIPAESLAGTVRLAIPELLGQHLIIPSLDRFYQKFPDIKLEITADVRPVNLAKRQADVVVRLVRPSHGDYLVKRVGSIALGLYGSAAYLEARGVPGTLEELADHRLIGWGNDLGYLPFSRWLFDAAPHQNIVFRAHTMSAQLSAVQANIGLAVLPAFIARKLGLVRALKQHAHFSSDIWQLQLSDAEAIPRISALVGHLSKTLASSATLLNDVD
jgi:DNA-binding transcriptional LysR family regulator